MLVLPYVCKLALEWTQKNEANILNWVKVRQRCNTILSIQSLITNQLKTYFMFSLAWTAMDNFMSFILRYIQIGKKKLFKVKFGWRLELVRNLTLSFYHAIITFLPVLRYEWLNWSFQREPTLKKRCYFLIFQEINIHKYNNLQIHY